MLIVIAVYLFLVFALPLAIAAVVGFRGLPRGRECPGCGADTFQLFVPALAHCSRALPRSVLQRRWCAGCGWEGVARLRRADAYALVAPAADAGVAPHEARPDVARVRDAGRSHDDAARTNADSRPATQTLDVKSLTLDGTPWRVMLQCWRNTDCYYGRFVFVAPSGRLWLDAIEAFNGASETEVLGQALSLPDVLLATRLRRLVADC